MSFKFPPTDWLICLLLCLLTFFLTLHGRKIWKWLCNFFKKKRARRALKPKSPADCPLCREGCTHLPDQLGQDIVPWSERKSRRGRPKTYNSNCIVFEHRHFEKLVDIVRIQLSYLQLKIRRYHDGSEMGF